MFLSQVVSGQPANMVCSVLFFCFSMIVSVVDTVIITVFIVMILTRISFL